MKKNKIEKVHIPLSKAILTIFLSILFISGSASLGWLYWLHLNQLRSNDDSYRIIAVVQTGPKKEALNTVYLEELLGLSIDQPRNLYHYDTQEAKRKLEESPLIKRATVKKVKPGTLYIDYSIREPIAYLGDYTNTALDADGILIPFKPFFTPKKLPEIFLGLSSLENPANIWGMTVKGPHLVLAYELLDTISQLCCSKTSYIRKIDVARAYADCYGQRQVIVVIEDWFEKEQEGQSVLCIFPRVLRLSTANYRQELADFVMMREYLQKQELQQIVDNTKAVVRAEPMIIDMRIPQLAFFKE